ncbi:MAG: aminoglycoside phosphotransferase family protein [Myxococcota bacterium]
MTRPISNEALTQLGQYATAKIGGAGAQLLGVPEATDLGGYEQTTHRLDLEYVAESGRHGVSVVAKAAREVEIRVLQRLASHGPGAIPQYLGSIEAAGRKYLLMPFYDGEVLDFGDVMPKPVFSLLAWMHSNFEENYEDLDFLPVTDEAYLSSLIETAAECVGGFARAAAIMKDVEHDSDRLYSTLAELPMTLLQGDVHPGNIIQLPSSAVLIDWGNARIGPRTVDLTNITRAEDAAWTYYTSECERFGTITRPERMLEDRTWATAITNLQYLPAGAAAGESRAEQMAAVVLRSIRQL